MRSLILRAAAASTVVLLAALPLSGCLVSERPRQTPPPCARATATADLRADFVGEPPNATVVDRLAGAIEADPAWQARRIEIIPLGGAAFEGTVGWSHPNYWPNVLSDSGTIRMVVRDSKTPVEANVTGSFLAPTAGDDSRAREMVQIYARAQVDWLEGNVREVLGPLTERSYEVETDVTFCYPPPPTA